MLRRKQIIFSPVPSFGHLSDLFSALPLNLKQSCDHLGKRLKKGEAITLILDSTGLGFTKAKSWYQEKYGEACPQRPWRKMHLAIDPSMTIHAVEITEINTSDISMMKPLLFATESQAIHKVIADKSYYSIKGTEYLCAQGILPVIPPPRHSVVPRKASTSWHDKIVGYIQAKGSMYAFHKKYGYGSRSLIEAQISRIKRCIGDCLKTQKLSSQKREGMIIAHIINRWNAFGQCIAVKTG